LAGGGAAEEEGVVWRRERASGKVEERGCGSGLGGATWLARRIRRSDVGRRDWSYGRRRGPVGGERSRGDFGLLEHTWKGFRPLLLFGFVRSRSWPPCLVVRFLLVGAVLNLLLLCAKCPPTRMLQQTSNLRLVHTDYNRCATIQHVSCVNTSTTTICEKSRAISSSCTTTYLLLNST
jgi:hypothetical protein